MYDQWQSIIRLGNQLRGLPSISSMIQVIQSLVDDLLDCSSMVVVLDNEEKSTPDEERNTHIDGATLVRFPLLKNDTPIGYIQCERSDKPFTKNEKLLISGVASQASLSLDLFLGQYTTQQQINRLLSFAEISNVIASILDVDILLNSITSLIRTHYDISFVYVFTIHPGQQKIQLRSESTGTLSFELDSYNFNLQDDNGPLSQAIELRTPIRSCNDLPNHPLSLLPPVHAKDELIIPLTFGEQVLGLLCLRSDRENVFDDSETVIFKALGDIIGVALRNANLYSTEQWRRQVTESMRDIAGLLSAEVNLDHLLNQLLDELAKTLPCEIAAIYLLENTDGEDNYSTTSIPLQLAALLSPDENIHDSLSQKSLFSDDEWLMNILESHYPVIRSSDMNIEPIESLVGYPSEYSAIISSLRVGLQPLGILILSHPTPGRYGNEAQLIVSTFANYAAVAIKNMQLYHSAHDQAWASTVLLQVVDATQSINNLSDLAETIVYTIPQLLGVNACGMLLWDKGIETFSPYATSGFSVEEQASFDQWQIPKNILPFIDQMLESHAPIILKRSSIPDLLFEQYFTGFKLDQEIYIIFPMVSHQDMQGAILINFRAIDPENDFVLWEDKYAIIQGIAHQTAVAIENIRLIQSQEEEAYVSIALLQVAQAIVSAADLDEVLSVVVRITPILVAMKKCAFFLWDFQKQAYILSQTYGISRAEITDISGPVLSFECFPLLDLTREYNKIVCSPMLEEGVEFVDWSRIKSEDCLVIASPEDISETRRFVAREILSSPTRLLLAYPLSVKDRVFGIMVTEEEFSDKGAPPLHIRERRLEIVTGITQQAALAIQNDFLQKEYVKREMLDRELQLAREIQMNFMPEILPKFDGWDLAARWLPAQQVGGDYFDIFELPNGNIGVVIADVADKGMPAALFMILVRTLLRATLRSTNSPAEALREVNELLVPDAKNGMFVTLFYGILAPETGKFVYVNAGHVPPILIRSTPGDFIELVPSSMALGVLSSIDIREREVVLLPGDSLILYTDGVSEAFSSDGDMYGRERLKQLLIESGTHHASQVLELIIRDVNKFTGVNSLSDDLTLIVLHRYV